PEEAQTSLIPEDEPDVEETEVIRPRDVFRAEDGIRDHVQAYVERPEKQRLQRDAAARGISVSQCVTDCLREYFAWREEMATVIDNPDNSGEAHRPGPIQVLLARMESRLAATLDARVRELVGELVLLQSMIDRQMV